MRLGIFFDFTNFMTVVKLFVMRGYAVSQSHFHYVHAIVADGFFVLHRFRRMSFVVFFCVLIFSVFCCLNKIFLCILDFVRAK